MRKKRLWLPCLASISLLGCANLGTIDRTTSLPVDANGKPVGKAIHLDAQQRLVMYRAGQYCAEPNPDALAAYASALGLGLSIPGQGAGSLSQAQQSDVASIGLRTQSITLMRDALYRMCEAYHNGEVGGAQVATMLARSQDLTAVVLAVEQMTGAVAANQVALTGTAGSNAAASLVSNQQLLDAARDNEKAKADALAAAENELETARTARDKAKSEEAAAEAKYHAAVAAGANPPTPQQAADQASLKTEWETRKTATGTAQTELNRAEANVKVKKTQLEDAKDVRQMIEASRDAALTNASAETSGAALFSVPVQQKALSAEATKEIATAVKDMITKVLDKSYVPDACMAVLMDESHDPEQLERLKNIRELCAKMLEIVLQREIDDENDFEGKSQSADRQ